jgi:predicted phosphohydrolase
MNLTFDIISDLNLTEEDDFNWSDKVTGLFCLVPGNVSSDYNVVRKTLGHLSKLYKGVFYVDGELEHKDNYKLKSENVELLGQICNAMPNVVYLHSSVTVMNGVAVVGVNGWYKSHKDLELLESGYISSYMYDDLAYLNNTIKKLQLHMEVKDIIIISSSIPDKQLYYGNDKNELDELCLTTCVIADTEKKIKYWAYGTYEMANANLSGIHFISNPRNSKNPYYAKTINLQF